MSQTFSIAFVVVILLCVAKAALPSNSIPTTKPPYEEYFIDHEVTETEATTAFAKLTNDFFTGPKPAYCGECTHKIMRYCHSNHLIQDHCCCDQRHGKEQLPWVPHSCYTGDAPCKPYLGSCFTYIEHRQCCCDRALANQLRSTLSAASTGRATMLHLPTIYILIRLIQHTMDSFYI